ncbi:hypothetical protein [Geoglobus ahangari]|nr:hypothetical protein [Geoglobus ahangari]
MDEHGETKIKELLSKENGREELVSSFFTQWGILLRRYVDSLGTIVVPDDIHSILLLSVLFEGFVKIVCFFEGPNIILSREKSRRTLGSIKNEFKKILSEKEDNKIKLCEIQEILDLFTKLRNEFLHFPFYYRWDYRFHWLFFQLVSYTLEKLDLWDYLDGDTQRIVKHYAKNKPAGISLLDVPLYSDQTPM